jgi:tight adherence protein B
MLIAIATFVVVLSIVCGLYWALVVRPEEQEGRTLRKRMKAPRVTSSRRPDLLRSETPLSSVAAIDMLLRRFGAVGDAIRMRTERAGLHISVGVVLLGSMFSGLVGLAIVLLLTHFLSLAVIAGAGASTLPCLLIKFKAGRRLMVFEEQFPEAMDLIARALRAGHAFGTGLSMVAEEIPDPVGTEFRLVYDKQNYGMPLVDALRDLAIRVPLLDARFFVTAVLTQREAGGNLAEVLDNLAALMRERFKVKRQVRSVSAHGRITGWVLAGLAPGIAAVLVVIAPAHISLLITDPLGIRMVLAALVMQVAGVMIIRKIINIEV